MVCLGFEPGVAGWKAETNPLFSVNTYSLATYWKRPTYEVAILGQLSVDAKD